MVNLLEKKGKLVVEPGTKGLKYVNVATMADGSDLRIAMHIVAGVESGPTLGLVATEHGDEILGMDIIRQIITTIDPKELSGQIVALPVANPLSFATQTYYTPIDGFNMWYEYPGTMENWLTRKMVYKIAHEVVDNLDYLICLHGAGTCSSVNDFIYIMRDLPLTEKIVELSKVFGQEILYLGPSSPEGRVSIVEYAAKLGVPSVLSELGTYLLWPSETKKFLEIGVRGVENVMKHLDMIPGDPEPPERQIMLKERTTYFSMHGGIYLPRYGVEDLGKAFPKGTLLGTTVNPHSFKQLEKITVPYDEGVMFMVRGRSRIQPGEYILHVGNMKTAERII